MDLSASVKPLRLAKLFAIVFGSIFAVILLLALIMLFSDTLSAWAWHARHGSTVTFSGLTFDVPLDAEPVIDAKRNHFEMLEFHEIRGGLLALDARADGPVLSDVQILQQQQWAVDAINSRGSKIPMTAETIHGQQVTYLCLRTDMRLPDLGSLGETLACEIPGTNLRVNTSAGLRDAMRARMLLYTATLAK